MAKTATELRSLLNSIDHRGYPAYKSTAGVYRFEGYYLSIDHVQGDPFASPSHLTIRVPGESAKFPKDYYEAKPRRVALQDNLTRRFHRVAEKYSRTAQGSGKSGVIATCAPGPEVLERTACRIDTASGDVLYRLEVGFPARGRTIDSGELIKILFDFLPECVREALVFRRELEKEYTKLLFLADDRAFVRSEMERLNLVAFVADGAVLPRESGISQKPMKDARPFKAPESLRVSLELPHRGTLTGMGIPKGITLIVGGGYHGKSTLLHALERGVYDHIAGDGREFVFTDKSAMKLRAEDGRSVHGVDISLFIRDLPDGRSTKSFSTEDASGSTSQAANVMEAIEGGSRLFLIDEDTCATNFMIRDHLMQSVIHPDKEPIIPFIDRIRALFEGAGISTILVAGSFGAFFPIADTIIQMDRYEPVDITKEAKEAAEKAGAGAGTPEKIMLPEKGRIPRPLRFLNTGERVKTKTLGRDGFSVNHDTVELRYVEQIVESGQSAALAKALLFLGKNCIDGKRTLTECIDLLMKKLEKEGPDALYPGSYVATGLTLPRRAELFACLNRCRFLNFE
ncbi:MAG: ABC-ATPase domain-containing protein [Lachnospiraceae bacterium]|nr:ABC-ATPase domain-containing protein [Lachnospiraceae bacterium]